MLIASAAFMISTMGTTSHPCRAPVQAQDRAGAARAALACRLRRCRLRHIRARALPSPPGAPRTGCPGAHLHVQRCRLCAVTGACV